MKGSVVRILIRHDWERHRFQTLVAVACGAVGLGLFQVGGEIPAILGVLWFFTSLIVLGCMLPISNVVNERKKQTLPFLMSLPLSVTQFTTAKLVSTVGIYMVPWLTLVAAAEAFVIGHPGIPNGLIPTVLILSLHTFLGFCLIASVAMVSESEGWTIAATVVANSTYGFSWYLLIRNNAIREGIKAASPVWGPEVLTVLACESAAAVTLLGLTLYLQSRKRDFV